MANNVDPDQTVSKGAALSGSALYVCAILSESLLCKKDSYCNLMLHASMQWLFHTGERPVAFWTSWIFFLYITLQPLYNTVRYNTVLDITRFKDGSQKCIDYIEK